MKLSIISPVYNAELIVSELVERISNVCRQNEYDFEILLVEDGSPDKSWEKIKENYSKNDRVVGIKLTRNFGQHAAITAGIAHASGDYVIVMDCDLQDSPEYIPDLIGKAKDGYDVVYTVKKNRKHGKLKNVTARLYQRLFNWLVSDQDHMSYSSQIGSYSLMSRRVSESFLKVGDYRRHFLIILRFLGYNSTYIEIEHAPRLEGKSSYSLRKLLNHALDGIISQSTKLLKLTISVGLIISFCSMILGALIIIQALFFESAPGWASTMVVVLFIGGLTIMSIGVSALYIGSIAEQVRNRPIFITDEILKN